MSNDLISRSAVMDYLREQHAKIIIEKNKNKYGIVTDNVLKGMQEATDAFINFIVQVPTAYDVEKVKESLNKLKEIYPTGNGNYEQAVRVDKAIEAVEAGGLNEQ